MRTLLVVLACVAGTTLGLAQEPTSVPGGRDTIFVVRRDTVVLMRRDTVFFERQPASPSAPAPQPSRSNAATDLELQRLERIDRLRELREARAAAYEAELAARPLVRVSPNAKAIYLYPTRLLDIDFPSVFVSASIVQKGRVGAVGLLGILTAPNPATAFGFDSGKARYGLRGVDVGLEGRYYISSLRSKFPFYAGAGVQYAIAPLTFERFVRNAEGTFDEFAEVNAWASRFGLNLMTGWELRTQRGLAIDFSTGFTIGTKKLDSKNAGFQRDIQDSFWNLNGPGEPTPFLLPILRIGIGFGKW